VVVRVDAPEHLAGTQPERGGIGDPEPREPGAVDGEHLALGVEHRDEAAGGGEEEVDRRVGRGPFDQPPQFLLGGARRGQGIGFRRPG
jgi:hypothetical protein